MKDNGSTNGVLLRRDENGVAILTLNAPRSINSLSEEMLTALSTTLDEIAVDRSVKAVILRSSGDHFCAGHNLKEMTARRSDADGGFSYFQELFAACSAMMLRIVRLPQPVIAEVRGIATAAGCQLVASCDLAVAADDARFATSGVNIGLLPASRVAELGLVNKVVPLEGLEDAAIEMARAIADKSPAAIRIGKRAFYEQAEMPLAEAYAHAGRVMAENMMARDADAGIGAFTRKSPMPDWTGE